MKLARNIDRVLLLTTVFVLSFVWAFAQNVGRRDTYAANEDGIYEESEDYFVTFYDEGAKLTVRTDAPTVGEAIKRAGITVNATDIVEPGLDTAINMNNFFINIHRSRPAVVRDGLSEKYIMTASYEPKAIAREAGIAIYDGDEVRVVRNDNFLEAGVANAYEVVRNGGRTLTEEVELPFGEQTVKDYSLDVGVREVRTLGEVGMKVLTYEVFYEDGVEVRRDLTSEEVKREPVDRVVAVGAKPAVRPEASECAEWVRQAGVAEADVSFAVDLIYHESGCRVNATNASSGAYGIPQALPGSKMAAVGADWETNPVTQIKWMSGYVTGRYGGWRQAVEYWYAHGWY